MHIMDLSIFKQRHQSTRSSSASSPTDYDGPHVWQCTTSVRRSQIQIYDNHECTSAEALLIIPVHATITQTMLFHEPGVLFTRTHRHSFKTQHWYLGKLAKWYLGKLGEFAVHLAKRDAILRATVTTRPPALRGRK